MGVTCGAGTAYSSGAPEFVPVFYLSYRSVVHVVKMYVFTYLNSCCYIVCPLQFQLKNDVRFVLIPICLAIKGFMFYLCYLYVFAYTGVPTRFPCQIMFLSSNSNTTDVTCGAGTANPTGAHECTPVFRGIPVAQSFIFCTMFCRSCLSFCPLAIVFFFFSSSSSSSR
jgi:hypothetical protein